MPEWGDLVEMWLDYLVGTGKTEATIAKYGQLVRRLERWWRLKGKRRPSSRGPLQATPQDLELVTGYIAHEQGLAPRSRKPLIAAVKMFYRWAHRSEFIGTNPAAQLEYPEAGAPLPVQMQLHHADKLLMEPDIGTFQGLRDAALITTFLGSGMRISELVRMNERDLLWVEDEKRRERLLVRVLGKRRQERIVPMPAECGMLLRAYLGHEDLKAIDRSLPDGDKVLWVSLRNRQVPEHEYHGEARRLSARSIRDLFVVYGKRAGIPRDQLHPHAIRHLYGAELAEEDVDLLRSKALMGHRATSSSEIYRHLALRKLQDAVDRANPIRRLRAPVLERVRELARRLED